MTRARLHADVPRLGLKAEIGGSDVRQIARATLDIAREGLRHRANRLHGEDETAYIDPLLAIAESGQTRADWLLKQTLLAPDFPAKKIFETERLQPPARLPGYINATPAKT